MDLGMYSPPPFVLFGSQHLVALAFVTMFAFGVPIAARRYASSGWQYRFGVTIAVLLVVHEVARIGVRSVVYYMPIQTQLPLQLCSIALYLVIWTLLTRAYSVYEIVYFWAMGGTLQALLTPDLQQGFPGPMFLNFFVGHGLVILGVLYATVVYRFRPWPRSIIRSLAALALVTLVVMPINIWLDTNYLYLMEKPARASLIDYLGPWPWYIPGLAGIALLSSLFWYLPFWLTDRIAAKRRHAGSVRG